MTATVRVTLLSVGSCRARAGLVEGWRATGWRTFPALVAVVRHPAAGVILFDTGYGRALRESRGAAARLYRRLLPFSLSPAEEIAAQLGRLGLGPADVRGVFLSHFHPDHIGGLRELPAVPILCSRVGLERLRGLGGLARLRAVFLPELLPEDFSRRASAIEDRPLVPLGEEWRPFERAHDLLGDGSLRAIALPGHAAGQFGLVCRLAGGRQLFLVADAAWVRSNFTALALPAWPVRRLLGDAAGLVDTLRRLHALSRRQPDLLLVPSHCEASHQAFNAGRRGE